MRPPPIFLMDVEGFAAVLPKAAGVLLGLDYGQKRIGVAISEPTRRKALPLETIHNNGPEHVASSLREIARSSNAVGLVYGYPVPWKSMNAEERQVRVDLMDFLSELYREKFYLDTEISGCLVWHEEYSTIGAKHDMPIDLHDRAKMHSMRSVRHGKKRPRSKKENKLYGLFDQEAAAYILQDAMDNVRRRGSKT